jgi:hypothetical protein
MKMTEHVHEWALRIAKDGRAIARCVSWSRCQAELSPFEIDDRLNATERLSAEVANQARKGYGSGWVLSNNISKKEVLESLRSYADIREGK